MEERLFVEKDTKRVVIGGTKAKLQLPSLAVQDVVIVSHALDNTQVLVFPETLFKEKFEPWEEHTFNYPEQVVKEAAYVFGHFNPNRAYVSRLYLPLCEGEVLRDLLVEYGVPSTWKIRWYRKDDISPSKLSRSVYTVLEIEKA